MNAMYDFHTHSLLSDGALCPAEHIRRAQVAGYAILGFSDHSDLATLPVQIPVELAAVRMEQDAEQGMIVLAGTELTHVRPAQIAQAVRLARELGAAYVAVHGQTLVEPVMPGTNLAAIEAGVDYLAHPGLITLDEAKLAAERGVFLEISGRKGHSLSNGHVVRMARQTGAKLIFGSDAHAPADMPTRDFAELVCRAAGLDQDEVDAMFANARAWGQKLAQR